MSALARQVAIAAVGRAFASRDVKNAEAAIADGKAKKIKATIEVDGVISRGYESEQAPSASPLQDALLVVLTKGMSKQALAGKIRSALKIAKDAAAAKSRVIDHVSKSDAEFAALIADVKAQASSQFPATSKKGALKFKGTAEVISAKAAAA